MRLLDPCLSRKKFIEIETHRKPAPSRILCFICTPSTDKLSAWHLVSQNRRRRMSATLWMKSQNTKCTNKTVGLTLQAPNGWNGRENPIFERSYQHRHRRLQNRLWLLSWDKERAFKWMNKNNSNLLKFLCNSPETFVETRANACKLQKIILIMRS